MTAETVGHPLKHNVVIAQYNMAKKKKILKTISTHLIASIFGVAVYLISSQILDYSNRPINEIHPKSIYLVKKLNNSWDVVFNVTFVNKGNSDCIVNVKSFDMLFPAFSNRFYSSMIDEIVQIGANSNIEKVFTLPFSDIFNKSEFDTIPNLTKYSLATYNISTDDDEVFAYDSTNIFYKMVYGKEEVAWKNTHDVKIDSSAQTITLETKPFYITYKNKRYINKIYPRDAIVKYKIENDQIFIEYTTGNPVVLKSHESGIIEPFMFFPNIEIADKIVLPTKIGFQLIIENRKADTIDYEKYLIEIDSDSRNYIFLLKNAP
ncbi:MAG: hypothetical protein KKA84_12190 [Bacteroidetes bacterium]|nr:hypothetical protein [Bacteroidota bacterium]